MKHGAATCLNLGPTPYGEAWDLQRSLAQPCRRARSPTRSSSSSIRPSSRSAGARTSDELHVPDERRRRGRRDRPRRQVHVPRAGTARLLPDPRPQPARARREALLRDLEEARHPDARAVELEARGIEGLTGVWLDGLRGRSLDRRAHLALGDDARLRAQRRPRPGAVHGVDHGLRARGRGVHDDGARARPARQGRRGAPACRGGARGGLRPRPRGAARPTTARALAPAGPREDLGEAHRDRQPDQETQLASSKSLPVAERPRRPEWMKVRAPSADSRYFEVQGAAPRPTPAHDLRGGALPEHRRVLGARHRDVPDPRRHLHARLPLLLRPLRQAGRAARPARAAPARAGRRADGAQARRRHLGRPRRRARPRRRPLRGDDPRAQGEAAGGLGRGADAGLPRRRGGGARDRARRAAGGVQPQHRDRPPTAPAHARREGLLRQGALAAASARRRSPTTPC